MNRSWMLLLCHPKGLKEWRRQFVALLLCRFHLWWVLLAGWNSRWKSFQHDTNFLSIWEEWRHGFISPGAINSPPREHTRGRCLSFCNIETGSYCFHCGCNQAIENQRKFAHLHFANARRSFGHKELQWTASPVSRSARSRCRTKFETNFKIFLWRLPCDITISKNIIPFPFVDLEKLFGSACGCDAWVSSMLDIIAFRLPPLVWLANSRLSRESSGSWYDSSTWLFGPLDMKIHQLDPSLDVDRACISIPYWSRQHVICPPVHAMSSESGLSRCALSSCANRTSKAIIYIVNSFEILSDRDFLHQSSRLTDLTYFYLTW